MAALPMVALGASVIGGGLSAYSRMQQGEAQASMYNYRAGIADTNAKIAAQNAEYAMNSGQQQAAQRGLQLGQQLGETQARYGASNIDVSSGSAKDVQDSERLIGGIDTANILNHAARVAYGYQVEEQSQKTQADMYRSAASDTKKGAALAAIGSLVSGAGSVADKWYQYGQTFGSGAGSKSGGDTDLTYSNYGFNFA